MGFDKFMKDMRVKAESISDPDRSTIEDDLDALVWQLREIARTLTEAESPNQSVRQYALKAIREHLDTAIQRSYRAKQIDKGQRVPKAR